jgi:predicted phage terminase large subunit-like protein
MGLPSIDHGELVLELARHWLGAFVLATMPDYDMGWVHERVCDELEDFLQAVVERKSPRLMITMPPRSGKSQLASRHFPSYALGRYPDLSIIATSYSADLASRMNRDVQRIMAEESYGRIFPESSLSEKNVRSTAQGSYLRNSDIFEIVGHRGVYRSAGVGGGVTGMGADICILDDVLKDRASADSPTIRQNIWDWYTSTLYTRLAPGGGVIIMNTRWHEDDLSGRLLDAQARNEGDEWRVVNFPAIAEVDEPPYRKKGEALHPNRYPLEQLLKIKATIGTRDWEALYQQHPVPDGGAIFRDEWLQKTWLPKDLPAKFDAVIMSWDLAFKSTDASDFVVGQLVGRYGADYYLLDQLRGRWSFTETVAQVKELAERARARFPRTAPRILIEDKANGPAVIDALKHEVSGIIPVEPDGSKEARAHAVTALFEAGNVLLPDRSLAPWIDEYRLELTRFPSGAHDDQVDATTQALRYLSAGHRLNIAPQLQRQLQGFRFRR